MCISGGCVCFGVCLSTRGVFSEVCVSLQCVSEVCTGGLCHCVVRSVLVEVCVSVW